MAPQQPQRSRTPGGDEQSSPPGASEATAGPAIAIIDGSNVAHSSEGERARLANIVLVAAKLREEGLEPVIVADAALRHQIDDSAAYERLIDEGTVKQAPAGTDADYFILSFARELDATVVSNDRFRDRISKYPEVAERIIRYMIVADEVVFERRGKRRKE
jgi:hypothetical protein